MSRFIFSFCFVALLCFAAESVNGASDLHFYLHDVVGTAGATVTTVSQPKDVTTGFGMMSIIDDKLTEGPSADSKEIGRAQGTYMGDSMTEFSLLMTFTAVFDNGSISVHGQDKISDKTRELAVIGGTGVYRFSRGYATITTSSVQGMSAVLDVNVYLKK